MDDYGAISHPFGLATGDLALLTGGIALVLAVLFLGIAGNRRGRRRWLGAIGWLILILSFGALGFGTVRSTTSANPTQPA